MTSNGMNRVASLFLAGIAFVLPGSALAATLSIVPAPSKVEVGDVVTVSVLVSSGDQAMNALSGTLTFPPNLLRVSSLSKGGSIISLWIQEPSFSNAAGTVQFEGVVPNPGYSGLGGRVLTITFVAASPGNATLAINNGQVLANDGNGTDILNGAPAASITIVPKTASAEPSTPSILREPVTIRSSTHPDQKITYPNTHVVLDWTNHQDTTAVRIGYNRFKDVPGTVVYEPPISHKEIDLEDGIWYFHVQEKNASGGWGPTATFAIRIDSSMSTAPSEATSTPIAAPVEPAPPSRDWSILLFAGLPLVLIILAFLLGYLLGQREAHGAVPLSARRARAALHKEFSELKDAVTQEIRALQGVRSRHALTVEDERLVNRVHKLIDRSERAIEEAIEETS